MNLLTIGILFLVSSCNPFLHRVDYSFIQKAQDLGSKNQGLNKIIYQNKESYVMVFNNGSRNGSMNHSESDYNLADILNSEINDCENLCKTNDKVSVLEVQRTCDNSISVNMGSLCLAYTNQIKCICSNQVNKTFTRSIVLSESEIKSRTKVLESVIWIYQ